MAGNSIYLPEKTWHEIDEELNCIDIETRSAFIQLCIEQYFSLKNKNKFPLNYSQVLLGIIFVFEIIILGLLL